MKDKKDIRILLEMARKKKVVLESMMKQNKRIQKFLSIIFSLALILLLAVPSQVLAQEETPQPEPTAEVPVLETPAETPAVEAIAAGSAPLRRANIRRTGA